VTTDTPATETPESQETVEAEEGTQAPPGIQEPEPTTMQEAEPEVPPGEEGQAEEASEEEPQSEQAEQTEEEQPSDTGPISLIAQTVALGPFPAGAKVIATLESQELGALETYDDPWDPSMKDMRVEYGIRHFNNKGRASTRISFIAQIEPRPPFVPPTDLVAEVHEGLVTLQWSAEQESLEMEPSEPEAVEPEAVEPEAVEPEAVEPETVEPETVEPETVDPETSELEVGELATVEPEAGELESLEPERVEREYTYAFNIFRKSRKEDYYPQKPVNAKPVEQPRFDDRKVIFGQPWCYIVRRVALLVPEEPIPIPLGPVEMEEALGEDPPEGAEPSSQAGETPSPLSPGEAQSPPAQPTSAPGQQTAASQTASPALPGAPVTPASPPVPIGPPPLAAPLESGNSEEVCVTPLDTFAPKTPDDVFAVTSSGGILLSWREADASDLAGYRVYRAERSEGPYELMTPEPIRLGSFMDRNVEPGVEYHYKVSAVDRAEPENESPQSASESARASEP
jgi:hypothetical protein